MLKQLGIEIDFIKNHVTLGIENTVLRIEGNEAVESYQSLLSSLFPDDQQDIAEIITEIKRIMKLMEVQYGIDNPAFLDPKEDGKYFLTDVLPWMFKYAFTFKKIEALNEPVVDFLKRFTKNQSLLDIISQHFFKATPAFFALSYIKLYLDYYYPRGGTGKLVESLIDFIQTHNGEIKNNTKITKVEPEQRLVIDSRGNSYSYQQLVWAADLKTLYHSLDPKDIKDPNESVATEKRKTAIQDKKGNDSVLTLYLGVDLEKSYFAEIASEHFFYTPSKRGETAAGPIPIGKDQETIFHWLTDFFTYTTYEISIPVLRDATMAPEGKTGLIISVLFDYHLAKYIQECGWYDEFKAYTETCIIQSLVKSIYPKIAGAILHQFSSTPLTIEKITGNSDGAITGWSFLNQPMPAENRLPKIFSATQTPIDGIFQAGQWTYSPSGLPISLLTGKLAADGVIKELRKNR